MNGAGSEGGDVPDLAPGGAMAAGGPPACPECPIADVIERKEREARQAAWAGILVAVLGVLSWNTWGFIIGGVGAIVLGLYARAFARRESLSDLAAGLMAFAVLGLRLAGIL